jgi:hypothetical protein
MYKNKFKKIKSNPGFDLRIRKDFLDKIQEIGS